MRLGDQIGLETLWSGPLNRAGNIDPSFQALQLWTLAGMGQGISLKSTSGLRQGLQLAIEGTSEGVDDQGSEIFSTPESRTGRTVMTF